MKGEGENRSLAEILSTLIIADVTDTEVLLVAADQLEVRALGGQYHGLILDFITSAADELRKAASKEEADRQGRMQAALRLVEAAENAIQSGYDDAMETKFEAAAASAVPAPRAPGALETDEALFAEFISECRDHVAEAEGSLLTLESDPDDREALNTIFRAFHSLKGLSAFLGFHSISELAHHTESLLARTRDGAMRFRPAHADLCLRALDIIKVLVGTIAETGGQGDPERPPEHGPLLESIVRASQGAADEETGAAAGPARAEAAGEKHAAVESLVRVRTDRLDRLLNLVGELVIAQAMLDGDATVTDGLHFELMAKSEQVGKVVRELQNLSMALRMVPLKATFQKMTRLVRDLSQRNGKPAKLSTFGEETEIDRNLVEVVNELLIHMVRNAMDHGLEMPGERRRAGKAETGSIRLSAYHKGGYVVFEVEDDGKGLDRDRIVAKAVEKGLIATSDGMTDTQVHELIFAPGFSTAAEVTDISGRGVGMDVVKRKIEALRGRVEIRSTPGRGCLFLMRVPLTMAITNGMLVRVSDHQYIIPTANIKMSLKPELNQVATVARRGEMLRFLEEMLPVCRLHRIFHLEGAEENATEALLIILEDGSERFALMVDGIIGQVQVVAKSLGDGVGIVPGISGGAILGDGRVGLILDPEGLRKAREMSEE